MEFKDLNFKIAVVGALNELGYYIEEPKALHDATEWTEDFVPIPEVLAYYKNLQIDPAYLAEIEELMPDGGDFPYQFLFTNWDGEDDQFDITSIEGIEQLVNLKQFEPLAMIGLDGIDFTPILGCKNIRLVSMSGFAIEDEQNEKVREELEERGVEVE